MAALSRWGGLLGSFALLLCCLPAAGNAAAFPAEDPPQVYFIAGVDLPVDVTLDGESVVSLQPEGIHGPVTVTAGEHTVAFRSSDWTAETTMTLEAPSQDVVVHRPADASGQPTVTVFENDVSPVAADRARITIAHTAVVPPADVRVAGKVLFANIANGEFVTAEVPEDTYSVDIVPTGGSTPVFGPVDLEVRAGALNRVFAIGQPTDGSMDAIVQVLPLRTTNVHPPADVDAGGAGMVAPVDPEPGSDPRWATYAALALGLACLAWVGTAAVRTARHARRIHATR